MWQACYKRVGQRIRPGQIERPAAWRERTRAGAENLIVKWLLDSKPDDLLRKTWIARLRAGETITVPMQSAPGHFEFWVEPYDNK